jgi:hypothetical protein
MSSPNTPLDPEKQPALVRTDAYEEWRKREGSTGWRCIHQRHESRGGGSLAAQGR